MQREIGSNFWLNPNEEFRDTSLGSPEQFGCYGNNYIWLSTGRSAIKFAIKTIEERNSGIIRTVLLPPFTCHTVIEPFEDAGYDICFYPVEKNLTTSSDAILQAAKEHDATIVLFHRYFGFDTIKDADNLCDELKKKGIYSIEDCTQCLYSGFKKSDADFFVGSIRKWTGTPDGGFIVSQNGFFKSLPQKTDSLLEDAKLRASYAKYKFLFENKGEKSDFLQQYREAENILASQKDFYLMCQTSVKVQSNLNRVNLKKKRRENWEVLYRQIVWNDDISPLFSIMGEDVVPLYFPVMISDRSPFQSYLAQNDIFAPVVWPKPDGQPLVCEGAENAYQHLLCIPIDQRYGKDDMQRIAEIIHKYYKR